MSEICLLRTGYVICGHAFKERRCGATEYSFIDQVGNRKKNKIYNNHKTLSILKSAKENIINYLKECQLKQNMLNVNEDANGQGPTG